MHKYDITFINFILFILTDWASFSNGTKCTPSQMCHIVVFPEKSMEVISTR